MLLAGDIGGTKTDLAVYSPEAGPRTPLATAEFPSQAYPSLEAIARRFLADVDFPLDIGCFAVAGPVIAGQAKITNLPWLIQASQLAEELGLATVFLLNDLEATAAAVPALSSSDLFTLNPGQPVPHGPLAVIAPGTGLGEAFLTWDGAHYQPHPSEGGHADFAPTDALQTALLSAMIERFGHVSYEHVCSGIAIPLIYDFLRDAGHETDPAEFAQRLAATPDRTPPIVQAALDAPQMNPLCAATLDLFIRVLGAEAGNLTLKVLATGGAYLGGGIPPRILPALEKPSFMEAFQSKGRFSALLADVPVNVILRPAALIGAATFGLQSYEGGAAKVLPRRRP